MKRLGLVVLLVGLIACEKEEAPPQASRPAPPGALAAPVDAAPAMKQMTFVPPAVDAAVAPEPEPEPAENKVDEEEEASTAFALAMEGEGHEGSADGDVAPRKPGSDLAAQLEDVKRDGANVKVGGDGRHSRVAPEDERPPPATPNNRISLSSKRALDASTLDVELVVQKILSAYMAGLKRCYKDTLRKDPTVTGAMTLAFEVNESGRSTGVDATFVVEELALCVEGMMKNWRFPVPKDDDGEATSARFELVLQLRTDP